MARRGPRLVLATERGVTASDAVTPLSAGAVLAVLSTGGDPALPDAARAVVRERRVRALALAAGGTDADPVIAAAATIAGAALAASSRATRHVLDGITVARVVGEQLQARGVPDPSPVAERARRAFEATLDALVAGERERERDAEAASAATAERDERAERAEPAEGDRRNEAPMS